VFYALALGRGVSKWELRGLEHPLPKILMAKSGKNCQKRGKIVKMGK